MGTANVFTLRSVNVLTIAFMAIMRQDMDVIISGEVKVQLKC
jgi:hypothetical protein